MSKMTKRAKKIPKPYHLVPCVGQAHTNPFIDNCMLCLNASWGKMKQPCDGEDKGCFECLNNNPVHTS
jgi:hypothetical protein